MVRKIKLGWEKFEVKQETPYCLYRGGFTFKGDIIDKRYFKDCKIVWMEYEFQCYTYVVQTLPNQNKVKKVRAFMAEGVHQYVIVEDLILSGAIRYWKQIY